MQSVQHWDAMNAITPELYCTDLATSLAFYCGPLGFTVLYDRPEDGFAFLRRESAELMLEQLAMPGRRWITGPLERPFGRGLNLQIAAADARALYAMVLAAGHTPHLPLEERWYRLDTGEVGNLQFIVADPDGYLLRFATDLGRR